MLPHADPARRPHGRYDQLYLSNYATIKIVDELRPEPGAVVLPSWVVDYVAAAPGGAQPSYALDYSARDNDQYQAWDAISRDRETFTAWLEAEVFGSAADRAGASR